MNRHPLAENTDTLFENTEKRSNSDTEGSPAPKKQDMARDKGVKGIERLTELVKSAEFDAVLLRADMSVICFSPSAKRTVLTQRIRNKKHLLSPEHSLSSFSVGSEVNKSAMELSVSTVFGVCPAVITDTGIGGTFLAVLLPELSLISASPEHPLVMRRVLRLFRGYTDAIKRIDSHAASANNGGGHNAYLALSNELIAACSESFQATTIEREEKTSGDNADLVVASMEAQKIIRASELFEEACGELPDGCAQMNPTRFLLIVTEAVLLCARCKPKGKMKLWFQEYGEGVELYLGGNITVSENGISSPLCVMLLHAFGAEISKETVMGSRFFKIRIPFSGDYLFEVRDPGSREQEELPASIAQTAGNSRGFVIKEPLPQERKYCSDRLLLAYLAHIKG
ncbi:MAG: hypothetical protein IKB34_07265 [Clostridia bacterium]|nr:hypothetical protein [Clostridia bacterium]